MLSFEKDITECLRVLKEGGLILYPTDTVWGIGCDARNEVAVEKIYQLKKRPDHKSMIVLVASERDVLQYVAAPDLRVFDYLATTSKPTTVIYDAAIGLAGNLIGTDGSIGIRVCQEIFCKHLIKRFRSPIVSTSANISGQNAAASFADINPEIIQQVDYVVKYRQEDTSPASPSSVIRWTDGKVSVIRP